MAKKFIEVNHDVFLDPKDFAAFAIGVEDIDGKILFSVNGYSIRGGKIIINAFPDQKAARNYLKGMMAFINGEKSNG